MRVTRRWLFLCVCLFCLALPLTAYAADERNEPLSPGLMHFAAATDLSVAGRIGEIVYFDEQIFCRGMNLSAIEYITVESLPEGSEGTLYLGKSAVTAGQVISAGNLAQLSFAPACEDRGVGSFTFSHGASGYAVECRVYTVRDCGASPTLSYAPEAVLTVSTYKELSFSGWLSGYDPDGDAIVFEIVRMPAYGSIRLTDRKEGTYVYTPMQGYTGEDSFSYVARDLYGNYSGLREVTLSVEAPTLVVDYADIDDDTLKGAAMTVEMSGLMNGRVVGGEVLFCPDEAVTRVDFLVMAMKAVSLAPSDAAEKTVFLDDAQIPDALRGYVAAAYEKGIVSGVFGKNGLVFEPNRAITRAEAARILSLLLSSSSAVNAALRSPADMALSVTVFADMISIPAWAETAMYHLASHGIIRPQNGYAAAAENLTRGDAAAIFSTLMTLNRG